MLQKYTAYFITKKSSTKAAINANGNLNAARLCQTLSATYFYDCIFVRNTSESVTDNEK